MKRPFKDLCGLRELAPGNYTPTDFEVMNEAPGPIWLRIAPRENLPPDSLGILTRIIESKSVNAPEITLSPDLQPAFLAQMLPDRRREFFETFQALCDIRLATPENFERRASPDHGLTCQQN